jgi:hypothetical protein
MKIRIIQGTSHKLSAKKSSYSISQRFLFLQRHCRPAIDPANASSRRISKDPTTARCSAKTPIRSTGHRFSASPGKRRSTQRAIERLDFERQPQSQATDLLARNAASDNPPLCASGEFQICGSGDPQICVPEDCQVCRAGNPEVFAGRKEFFQEAVPPGWVAIQKGLFELKWQNGLLESRL